MDCAHDVHPSKTSNSTVRDGGLHPVLSHCATVPHHRIHLVAGNGNLSGGASAKDLVFHLPGGTSDAPHTKNQSVVEEAATTPPPPLPGWMHWMEGWNQGRQCVCHVPFVLTPPTCLFFNIHPAQALSFSTSHTFDAFSIPQAFDSFSTAPTVHSVSSLQKIHAISTPHTFHAFSTHHTLHSFSAPPHNPQACHRGPRMKIPSIG